MAKFVLRQGDVTTKLSEFTYKAAEGFFEDNSWHVTEECLSAISNTKLTDGPATISHGDLEFPVVVTVLEFEPDEEEEDSPASMIEIGYTEGLPKLALALGLLEHLTPRQKRAISAPPPDSQ